MVLASQLTLVRWGYYQETEENTPRTVGAQSLDVAGEEEKPAAGERLTKEGGVLCDAFTREKVREQKKFGKNQFLFACQLLVFCF